MDTLFTVGHGTRSLDELTEVARSAGLGLVIDVRRFPGSRRHPHLAREPLAEHLEENQITYAWWGESMGGRRNRVPESRNVAWRNAAFQGYADHMASNEFRSALKDLQGLTNEAPTAVMCSETVWWRCHRRLIADAFVLDGGRVIHLLAPNKHQEHPLNPAARSDPDGIVVYDVGETPPLGS